MDSFGRECEDIGRIYAVPEGTGTVRKGILSDPSPTTNAITESNRIAKAQDSYNITHTRGNIGVKTPMVLSPIENGPFEPFLFLHN